MKPKNGQRQLTYDEIARKYDMTPAKAHSVVKQAYNKMVKALIEREKINIFDAILALREYFNMSEQEAYDKLTDEHKELLKEYAIKEFDIRSKKGKA
jgi:hypothetical protein